MLSSGCDFRRCVPYEQVEDEPVLVYTDADGSGGLGMTAFDTRSGETFQFSVPSGVRGEVEDRLFNSGGQDLRDDSKGYNKGGPADRNERIQLYETEAVAVALLSLFERIKGRCVTLWVDNESLQGSLCS